MLLSALQGAPQCLSSEPPAPPTYLGKGLGGVSPEPNSELPLPTLYPLSLGCQDVTAQVLFCFVLFYFVLFLFFRREEDLPPHSILPVAQRGKQGSKSHSQWAA